MNLSNERWSTVIVITHWASALLIVAIVVAGLRMTGLDPTDPMRRNLGRVHTVSGVLLGLTTLTRLIVQRRTVKPGALAVPAVHQRGITIVHGLLYAITLAVIATGLATGLRTTWHEYLKGDLAQPPTFEGLASRSVHEALAFALVGLVAAHVVGVAVQELRKSGTLRRMVPFLR